MGQPLLPPGYRFSPTDEELFIHYLCPKATGRSFPEGTVAEVDIYNFEPWDLPGQSSLPSKDRQWYFFSSQDKKNNTARINRMTKKGFWKATGKDCKVYSGSRLVGSKKTLIYYRGRAPKGICTNWVMHEYRLDDKSEKKKTGASVAVLCRIREKLRAGPRTGEQYGAPTWNEDSETGEDVNLQNVDVVPHTGKDIVENEDRGNVFNLQNQVEVWKVPGQMDLSKVASDRISNEVISARQITGANVASDCIGVGGVYAIGVGDVYSRKGTKESGPIRNDVLQSFSETPRLDTASIFYDHNRDTFPCPHENMVLQNARRSDGFQSFSITACLGTASNFNDHSGDTFPCPDNIFMQNEGALFGFSPLPALSDDSQAFALPTFDDEPEIPGELWDIVGDSQGDVSSTGATENVMLQAARNVRLGGDCPPLDGNFIELDDMKLPLHSSGFGWPEEQQLLRGANRVTTFKEVQDPVHSQGLAARCARLQIPVVNERLIEAGVSQHHRTLPPEVEKLIHGGSIGVNMPVTLKSGNFLNSNESYSGSGFNSCDTHHVMESSSRSFLSKHVTTYAVSKCEMLPGQLCYASFTEVQDGITTASNTISSSTAVIVGDESKVNTDALENITTIQKSSPGSQTATSNPEGRSPDVEDPLLQGPNSKTENATDGISLHGYSSWKKPLRGLVNKAKWSALGTRLFQLESGVRAKFNDKLSALRKPAAWLLPIEGNTANPYDSLRKIIVATLCQLAVAVLIFFCIFWGFRLLAD